MSSSQSQVQTVKEATDIVAVIGERLSLQRSGTYFKGLCPFHSESSPSFFVNEVLQRFKCYGCNEGGDVLDFLQKYEGMTFVEALQQLAEGAGITLEHVSRTPEDEQRERSLAALNLAKEYYGYLLREHAIGEPAREYLKERGVSSSSIKLFQLGYAPSAWDGLIKYLHGKKKYALHDLEAAGLVIPGRTGQYYDRFRGRLMFPLANHRGQVVGFSGRLLDKTAKEAKYINSPETALYHKGKMLFGYSELLQEIRKKGQVIVVEGEFDVVSSAQVHVNNVVAIKGSAMTPDHFKLIGRVAKTILLALDSDSAGIEATKRAIALARETELEVRVIPLVGGKDPDDLARTDPGAWRQAVKQSLSAYAFLIRAALKEHNPKTPEGKREIMTELAPLLAGMSHAVEQDFYIRELAQALEVKDELVRKDMQRHRGKGTPRRQSRDEAREAAQQHVPPPLTRAAQLESYAFFLLMQQPEAEIITMAHQLAPLVRHQPQQTLLERVLQLPGAFSMVKFNRSLPTDLQQTFFDLTSAPRFLDALEKMDLPKEWQHVIRDLKQEHVRADVAALSEELEKLDALAERSPEQEERQRGLLKQVVQLQRQLSA